MMISVKMFLKKAILDRIPPRTIVPMFGANWGRRWIIGSGNHNYWLGRDERAVQKAFQKFIRRGDVVYDIGAHVGFYTLLSAKLAGSEGRIYSFEPVPGNFEYLSDHLRLNGVNNAQAFRMAVADREGVARFEAGENTSGGHLSADGTIAVEVTSVDRFIAEYGAPPPDFVKIDVEGGEMAVLQGMAATLEAKRSMVVQLEANESRADIVDFLEGMGYSVERLDDSNIVCFRREAARSLSGG